MKRSMDKQIAPELWSGIFKLCGKYRGKRMYKHIIWDFDGTLFDTYPLMTAAFKKTLETYGFKESTDKIMDLMKISESHLFEYCKDKYGIGKEFKDRYDMYRKDIYNNYIKPFPEINNICKAIFISKRNNYLYTHRGKSAMDFLESNQLYEYFSDFITKENNFKKKPEPEALLYLLDKHDIKATEALMIGDRDIDILAAKNAGINACFFNNKQSKTCQLADHTIHDFKQLYEIIGM